MVNKSNHTVSFKIRSRAEIHSRLAEGLIEGGYLDRDRMDELDHRATWLEMSLERVVLDEGVITEAGLLEMLARITGVPVMDMGKVKLERRALNTVSVKTIVAYKIMPVSIKNGVLTLAADHVWDVTDEDHLRVILGYTIDWVLCSSKEINECIKHYYGVGVETFLQLKNARDSRNGVSVKATDDAGEDVPAFVREIIRDAIMIDATDLHIEPGENSLKVRYRIDGVLQEFPLPEGVEKYSRPIISSVKIMAQMDIAEHRIPQDGRFDIDMDKDSFDIRVSVLPMQFGETLNLRILNRQATFLDLKQLGLADAEYARLEGLITLPYGMVLFTGPTGSGKTTSLYAALEHLNSDERKIITLEDPVEYQIEGITQMQMDARIGFTFASGLRSVLRHDPDVVLIGEIRDAETADIAVSAALTGHLVFSTLHTNNSAGALTRLLDMNVEPYLVASGLDGVVAQRLLRMICPHCATRIDMDDALHEELKKFFPSLEIKPEIYQGRGCPHCRFTGYHGREPVFEIMEMDDELRAMTIQHTATTEMMRRMVDKGLTTLRHNGWGKVLEGRTTVEELLRVTRNSQ